MPGVIVDVHSGSFENFDGTFIEWEVEGFTATGTSERMRDRTVAKFPTSLLAVRVVNVDKIDERTFLRKISKKKYRVTTFIPEPSEEERVDIGLRFEKILEVAREQELFKNGD